jgi:hypothetical protein
MNQQQQQQAPAPSTIPVQQDQGLSEAEKQLVSVFTDLESKQLDFLDEASKSLIERISTFLTVLLGVTILNNTFPPAYLKGNLGTKWLVLVTSVSIWRPWVRASGVCFALGSAALAGLIGWIVWSA